MRKNLLRRGPINLSILKGISDVRVMRKVFHKRSNFLPKFRLQRIGELFRERLIFGFLGSGLSCIFILVLIVVSIFRFMGDSQVVYADVVNGDVPVLEDLLKNGNLLSTVTVFENIQKKVDDLSNELPLSLSFAFGNDNLLTISKNLFECLDETLIGLSKVVVPMHNVHQFAKDAASLKLPELKARYTSLTEFIAFQWNLYMVDSYPHFRKAYDLLLTIDSGLLPQNLSKKINEFRDVLKFVVSLSEEIDIHLPAFLSLLGSDYPKTYAILFQNSGEMRATGGFIGSLAMVKFNDGWVEYIEYKDVYDIDGEFVGHVAPPPGLEKITSDFRLRDSNYWPDFPTSARQIKWFLDKDKGPSIDGVFAISDSSIENIVASMGGIEIPGIQQIVPAEMFPHLLSFIVESKFNKTEPKEVLFQAGERLVSKMGSNILKNPEVIQSLLREVLEKRISAFAVDENVESLFHQLGVDGSMYNDPGSTDDYFLLTHTNLGGNKSDRFMDENILHETYASPEGKLIDRVTLTRRHLWTDDIRSSIVTYLITATGKKVPAKIESILGNGTNWHYLRVFVPKNSKLIRTSGIDVTDLVTFQDLGKTVFSFSSKVKPGETKNYVLEYELPFAVNSNDILLTYHVLFQKEPGGKNYVIRKKFDVPSGLLPIADNAGKLVGKPVSFEEETAVLKNTEMFGYAFGKR